MKREVLCGRRAIGWIHRYDIDELTHDIQSQGPSAVPSEIPMPVNLRDMIHRAQGTPDAVALFAPGCRPLTYSRLLDQIDAVGRTLRAHGIQRTDTVAVVLPNGPDMATAFLG